MTVKDSIPPIVKDRLFASLDEDLHLERIAGGNETEVYITDDQQYVIKVKSGEEIVREADADEALRKAHELLAAAKRIERAIGPEHAIPTHVIVANNDEDCCHPVVIQPYLNQAQPLYEVNYETLAAAEKAQIQEQLITIILRSVRSFWKEGWMPDLYGRTSASKAERKLLSSWLMLPWRLWSFLIDRNLLRSHNLMLTPDRQVVLVDYDPMPHGPLYRWVYYRVRLALFARDLVIVSVMLSRR